MNLRLCNITYNLLDQFLHSSDVTDGVSSSSFEDSRCKIRICTQSRSLDASLKITSRFGWIDSVPQLISDGRINYLKQFLRSTEFSQTIWLSIIITLIDFKLAQKSGMKIKKTNSTIQRM